MADSEQSLKHEEYRPRIVDKQLEQMLNTFGAVIVEGPKWCGKTWTAEDHANSAIYIDDPAGNYQNRTLAGLNADLVLDGAAPHLVDEWQEVPPIWDAVRRRVDLSQKKGQFILTGSATPNDEQKIHSGAGRFGRLHMRTMSLFESGDSTGAVSLKSLFDGVWPEVATGEVDLKHLIDLVVRGGWPGALGLSAEQASAIASSYLEAILNDDIRKVDGIKRDANKMKLLLHSLARNESTLASKKSLSDDITERGGDISAPTLDDYMAVLERLHLIANQPPFALNLRSSARVGKAVKRHLVDPSLSVAALGATSQTLFSDLHTFGFLFEALCERDLAIYAASAGGQLYHYHDGSNREIDAVVELPDGRWGAFEIKLGANQVEEAARHLKTVSAAIAEEADRPGPAVIGVICGMANAAYRRSDGVTVIPITALKD